MVDSGAGRVETALAEPHPPELPYSVIDILPLAEANSGVISQSAAVLVAQRGCPSVLGGARLAMQPADRTRRPDGSGQNLSRRWPGEFRPRRPLIQNDQTLIPGLSAADQAGEVYPSGQLRQTELVVSRSQEAARCPKLRASMHIMNGQFGP